MCGEEDWGNVALSGQSCLVVKRKTGQEMHLRSLVLALPGLHWVVSRVCKEWKISPCRGLLAEDAAAKPTLQS